MQVGGSSSPTTGPSSPRPTPSGPPAGGGRTPLAGTCRALADAAGLTARAPSVYGDGSGVDPDEELTFDPDALAVLLGWFKRGDAALRAFAPDAERVLWPEHFDVGYALDEVNYGVSPAGRRRGRCILRGRTRGSRRVSSRVTSSARALPRRGQVVLGRTLARVSLGEMAVFGGHVVGAETSSA